MSSCPEQNRCRSKPVQVQRGLRRPNRPAFLPSAFDCGFRPFSILLTYSPADLARSIGPFVDLLLTGGGGRKKPHQMTGRKALIMLGDFGCGGRI